MDAGARRYWKTWNRVDNVGQAEQDVLRPLFKLHMDRLTQVQADMHTVDRQRKIDPTIRAFFATAPITELAGVSLLSPLVAMGGRTSLGGGLDLAAAISGIGAAVRRTLIVAEAKTEWEKRTENLQHVCAGWTYDQSRRWLKSVDLNPERWPHELTYRLGAYLLREALISNALLASPANEEDILRLASARNHNGLRVVYQQYSSDITKNGILNLTERYASGRTISTVTLTERAFEALINGHLGNQDMRPVFAPMVMPPRPWTNDHDGGYNLLRQDLVKPVKFNGSVEPGTTEPVRRAVNVLQQTCWAVDMRVVHVMEEVWERGGGRCGLPQRERPPMPPRVLGGDPAGIKAAKLARKLAWDDWYNDQSARLSVSRTLDEAFNLDGMPVYFVWTMDFRGRMYPLADHLSPQGADYQKAPLVFAKAVECTSADAVEWLRVNLANLWGEDKVSIDDRVEWVKTNLKKIEMTAMDPMRTIDWWSKADKPWCFLAAVFDYVEWTKTHKSRIPVAMDGSCNGIQHLSALGRDRRGAQATNLLPCEVPNDIYQEVADELHPLIVESDSEYAQLFPKDRVTRKLVKRATMTTPYGVTRQGIRTQFITDGHLKDLPREYQSEISTWLTGLTSEAIGRVVRSASEIMEWLQYLAVECNKRGHAMQWVTPDGKLVTQEYLKKKEYIVRVPGMGKVTFRIADETLGINKNNQRNGTAPNYTHSLDANHARDVAIDMSLVTFDLAMVHDAFGCHAAYAPYMNYCIRENFITMHKQPLLERLHASVQKQLDFPLESPPIVGDLRLSLVSNARYFFA